MRPMKAGRIFCEVFLEIARKYVENEVNPIQSHLFDRGDVVCDLMPFKYQNANICFEAMNRRAILVT